MMSLYLRRKMVPKLDPRTIVFASTSELLQELDARIAGLDDEQAANARQGLALLERTLTDELVGA